MAVIWHKMNTQRSITVKITMNFFPYVENVINPDSNPDRWECRDIKILYIQDPFCREKQTAASVTCILLPQEEKFNEENSSIP